MQIATSVLASAVLCFLVPGVTGFLRAANPNPPTTVAPATPEASTEHRVLLDRYCVTCHNDRLRTAGLALDSLDLNHVGESAKTWEKVVRTSRKLFHRLLEQARWVPFIRELRAGVMPPCPRLAGQGLIGPPMTA